ncbi:MAG: hypothetical protein H6R07_192 [Proteobacteria bacterium]|nr:hypothetical protein [Pseudomonadota bacterium]
MIEYGLLSGANFNWLPSVITAAFDGWLWPVIAGAAILFLLWLLLK